MGKTLGSIFYSKSEGSFIFKNEFGRIHSATEADARARYLIYLAENKHIDPKEIRI